MARVRERKVEGKNHWDLLEVGSETRRPYQVACYRAGDETGEMDLEHRRQWER